MSPIPLSSHRRRIARDHGVCDPRASQRSAALVCLVNFARATVGLPEVRRVEHAVVCRAGEGTRRRHVQRLRARRVRQGSVHLCRHLRLPVQAFVGENLFYCAASGRVGARRVRRVAAVAAASARHVPASLQPRRHRRRSGRPVLGHAARRALGAGVRAEGLTIASRRRTPACRGEPSREREGAEPQAGDGRCRAR